MGGIAAPIGAPMIILANHIDTTDRDALPIETNHFSRTASVGTVNRMTAAGKA